MSLHLILGCMYSGKCYVPQTLILNEKLNFVSIQSLDVGDKVLGLDGKSKLVNHIHHSRVPCFLLNYEGGGYVISENHELVLIDNDSNRVNMKAFELRNKDFKNYKQVFKTLDGGKKSPLDAYAFGYFLSNKSGKNLAKLKSMKKICYQTFLKYNPIQQ